MADVVKIFNEAIPAEAGYNSTSGGTIAIGQAVGVNASGEICSATCVATNYVRAVGVALTTNTQGVFGDTKSREMVSYARNSVKLYDSTWAWTPGGTIYLLSGTNFSQTAPSDDNQMIQEIGTAINATSISVAIGTPLKISGGAIRAGI